MNIIYLEQFLEKYVKVLYLCWYIFIFYFFPLLLFLHLEN